MAQFSQKTANSLGDTSLDLKQGAGQCHVKSLFAVLQTTAQNWRSWTTRMELRGAIVVWIERKYHRQRRQAALVRLTPIEFETMTASPTSLAA